jgi:hypothetical protein
MFHEPLNLNALSETLPVLPPPAITAQPTTPSILSVRIHDFVDFTVSSAGSNFSRWRQIVVLLLTMYKALDHVMEGVAPDVPDDGWIVIDIHIPLWFMKTLAPDLHRLVQGTDRRALSTWTRLNRFFLDNQSSCYLFLSKASRSSPSGDLSDYASKPQGIADDLATIGRPLDDCDLTLQFIDGLGKKFDLQAEILKTNLPSFADACSTLQLAEATIDGRPLFASYQALAVHGGGRGHSSNEHGQSSGGSGQTSGGFSRVPGVSPNYKGITPSLARGENRMDYFRPTDRPKAYGSQKRIRSDSCPIRSRIRLVINGYEKGYGFTDIRLYSKIYHISRLYPNNIR